MDKLKSESNGIYCLPPELLEHVFDSLSLKDRKSASSVCRKWNNILGRDRYISELTLHVRPSTLDSSWALQRMKRPFRKLLVSSEGLEEGPEWDRFLDKVRQLVCSNVIKKHLEILRVFMSIRAANDIFGQREMICFAKLLDLTYSPGSKKFKFEEVAPRINVYAPSLHSFKIDCFNASCVEMLRMVAPRIKRLVLRFIEKATFLKAMSIRKFYRLHELCIHALPCAKKSEKMLSRDISDAFKANLEKLSKLDIKDQLNTFPYVYHQMFNAAIDLVYLNVEGIEMHPLALHAANNLTKLQVLQLLVTTTYRKWSCDIDLCLPELETLLLFPKLMARAGYLPKLQNFAVHNHTVHSGTLDENAIEALRTFSVLPSIKLLHLRDIVFNDETLEIVSSFQSTPQIFLEDIWDNISVLHEIVNSYPDLQLLKLIRCRFKAEEEDPNFGELSDDSEWETLRQAESIGQTFEFFSLSRLGQLFPNCTVAVHESFFMKHIGNAPWRQLERADRRSDGRPKC